MIEKQIDIHWNLIHTILMGPEKIRINIQEKLKIFATPALFCCSVIAVCTEGVKNNYCTVNVMLKQTSPRDKFLLS